MSDQNIMDAKKFGYVKDGKVFRKGFNKLDDLEIGEVRESEEQSLQYFVERYNKLAEKVDSLEKSVTDANKQRILPNEAPSYEG